MREQAGMRAGPLKLLNLGSVMRHLRSIAFRQTSCQMSATQRLS
jgi:hypothetical protein